MHGFWNSCCAAVISEELLRYCSKATLAVDGLHVGEDVLAACTCIVRIWKRRAATQACVHKKSLPCANKPGQPVFRKRLNHCFCPPSSTATHKHNQTSLPAALGCCRTHGSVPGHDGVDIFDVGQEIAKAGSHVDCAAIELRKLSRQPLVKASRPIRFSPREEERRERRI